MKNITVSLASLILILSSCDLAENDMTNFEQISTDVSVNKFIRANETYSSSLIKITCGNNKCTGGNVGPYETCQVGTDMQGNYECSCSGCEMTVFSNSISNNDEIFEQIRKEDHNIKEFENFTLNKHGQKISSFKSIEFNFRPLVTTISYTYELKNSKLETVMFSNTYDELGFLVKKVTVDCSGTCECREMYNATTNTFSCSCDQCTMTVTTSD